LPCPFVDSRDPSLDLDRNETAVGEQQKDVGLADRRANARVGELDAWMGAHEARAVEQFDEPAESEHVPKAVRLQDPAQRFSEPVGEPEVTRPIRLRDLAAHPAHATGGGRAAIGSHASALHAGHVMSAPRTRM